MLKCFTLFIPCCPLRLSHPRIKGVVVASDGQSLFAVNGVHPNPSLTCCYGKSLVRFSTVDDSVLETWSYDGSTLNHQVDMEGLTCGADGCEHYLFIGDEYNLIYQLDLHVADPASAVVAEWDINDLVTNVQADKGIESLSFDATTGTFFMGIQQTAQIIVVELGGIVDAYGDDASPALPTSKPSSEPSEEPSREPSSKPSSEPSSKPSAEPSRRPIPSPSVAPSAANSEVLSFTIDRAPSGMFLSAVQNLLYVICAGSTNRDRKLAPRP